MSKRLRADVVLGTLDQGAASLLAFVFHVVSARVYDNSVYGWLVLAWGAVALAVLVWRAAIGVPFVVEFSEADPPQRSSLFGLLLASTLPLQFGLLAFGTGLGGLGTWSRAAWSAPMQLAGAAAVLLAACLHREVWRHRLLGGLDTSRLAALGLAANILAAVVFVAAAVYFGHPASLSLIALSGGMFVGVLLARPVFDRGTRAGPVLGVVRRWWRFGRHILFGVLSTTGTTQLILWLLLLFKGDERVAVFGAVFAAVGLPRPALNAVTAILTPSLVRSRGMTWDRAKGRRAVALGCFLGALFVLGAGFLGPAVIAAIFPTIPASETALIVLLAIVVVLEGVNAVVRGVIRGGGRPRIESSAAMIGGGTGLVTALVAIPLVGVNGAAVSLLLMQLAFAVRGVWVLRATRAGGRIR